MEWTPSLMGMKGGKNRAKRLSPERRKEIASRAAKAKKGMKYRRKALRPKTFVVKKLPAGSNILGRSGEPLKGRERTRMMVRMRDNFTCQDCGEIRTPNNIEKGMKNFDVHHLNGMCGKLSRSYDKVDSLDQMITLCHKCHFNRPEHAVNKPNNRDSELSTF